MRDIYKHINSMRGSDKPNSFDDIARYLTERGFDADDIKHAITYVKRKEHDELAILKDDGSPLGRFNYLLSGILLIVVSLVSLYFAIRVTYIFFFSNVPLQLRNLELTPMGHIVSMISFWIGAVASLSIGIKLLKKQQQLRVQYQKRKKQRLL